MYNCIAIDDDQLFLRMIETYFEEMDSAKLMASYDNPVKGALGIVQLKPDVVLLDYDMPYIDGFEMLGMLRTRPKVIVISGYLKSPDLDKIPGDKFLPKNGLKDAKQLEIAINEVMMP